MKIHYTREQSEINRRKIYDYVSSLAENKSFKFSFHSDLIKFKNKICKYDKNYIWLDFTMSGSPSYAPYYDMKEKAIRTFIFWFEPNEEFIIPKFEERRKFNEVIKDKIKAKKATTK